MDILVGRTARAGEPTRLQHWRRTASGVLQRWLGRHIARWMRREHTVRVGELRLVVPVGVFPPKFFFSTDLLCRTLRRLPLHAVPVLELGSGSGAVSLTAARRGARVTAVDISEAAVYATRRNAAANGLDVDVRRSDLFGAVPERFRLVVVNPPYFRHDPATELDHAFHAGAGFEYFERLFAELGDHLEPGGEVLMTLAEGCEAAITDIAARHGWRFRLRARRLSLLQWNYLFALER